MKSKVVVLLGDKLKIIAKKIKTMASKAPKAIKIGLMSLGIVTILTAGLFSASVRASGKPFYYGLFNYNYDSAEYSTEAQIDSFAEILNADMSFMKENNEYRKLLHNGDEPIYVSFDKSIDNDFKEICEKSLNHIFSIIGQINENYKYEIVDDLTPYENNRSYICYYDYSKIQSKDKALGVDYAQKSMPEDGASTLCKNNIYLKQDEIKERCKEFINVCPGLDTYVTMHETMHALGFPDVCDEFLNTYINYSHYYYLDKNDIRLTRIMPDDVKRLCALYADPLRLNNPEYIQHLKEIVTSYEDYYYSEIASKYSMTNEGLEGNISISIKKVWINDIDDLDSVNIKIENGKYKISFIKKGKSIETVNGDAVLYKKIEQKLEDDEENNKTERGIIVLKNIVSENLSRLTNTNSSVEKVHTTLFLVKEAGVLYKLKPLSGGSNGWTFEYAKDDQDVINFEK